MRDCEGHLYGIEDYRCAELWISLVYIWSFPLCIVDFSCILCIFLVSSYGFSLYVLIHFLCILLFISIICKCGFYFYFIAVFTHKQMDFRQVCHCGYSLNICLKWISLLRYSKCSLYIIVDFSSVFSPHVIVLNLFIFLTLHKRTCYTMGIVSTICPLFTLTGRYKSTSQLYRH